MDGDGHKELPKPVDLCSLTPMVRQRVKSTWLAEPRTIKYMPPIDASTTLVRRTPFGLSVPALRAKCSPHTEILAEARNSRPKMHYMTKAEREYQRELEEEMTKEELRWLRRVVLTPVPTGVKKAALNAKMTPRLEVMSLAKLRKPEENFGVSKKVKKKKKSFPSHFPKPEPLPFFNHKIPRVCGCSDSVKRKFLGTQNVTEIY